MRPNSLKIPKFGVKCIVLSQNISVHSAFREATTWEALLKIFRDTGWERGNCKLEKL